MSLHSPAELLAESLYDLGVATRPGQPGDWPLYVSSMPNIPHECMTLYDTVGVARSRNLKTGEGLNSYGLQLRVRSRSYGAGWDKALSVHSVIETIQNGEVEIGGETVVIQSVSPTSPPSHIGVEEGTTRRDIFTANYLASLIRQS